MDRTEELEEQVRQLQRQVEEMRARMAGLEGRRPRGSARSSRRGFLRMGAAAAAGAVGWAAARAVPVMAANGAAVTTGSLTTGETPTTITGDGTANSTVGGPANPTPVFAAKSNGFVAADLTGALGLKDFFTAPLAGLGASGVSMIGIEGVDGWAQGPLAFGVYGLTDSGVGVTGESLTGIGVYSRGTGRILQDPQVAGSPTYVPDNFEQVRDANGILYIHSTGSGTGLSIWRRVNTPRVDAADGSGNAFKPLRLIDTRLATGAAINGTPQPTGGPRTGGMTATFTVAGAQSVTGQPAQNIPTDAIAVFGNLTVVAGNSAGFFAIHPTGAAFDATKDPATFNFGANQIVSNGYFCGLGTGTKNAGKISVYVGNTTQPANIIIDITGYVQ